MGHIKKLECRKPILVGVGPSVVNPFDERSCCTVGSTKTKLFGAGSQNDSSSLLRQLLKRL